MTSDEAVSPALTDSRATDVSPPGTRDHDRDFDVILDLIQQINQGPDLARVFELVAAALRRIFAIDRFALVLLDDQGELSITATSGLSERYLDTVRGRTSDGAGARALAQRRPLYIPDATNSTEYRPFEEAAREEGLRTILIIPLFSGPTPLGYLIMYHDRVRIYTPAEIALAQALAQQAAVAMHHVRLLAATEARGADFEHRFQQRVNEMETIDDILLRISSSLDLESTLDSITRAAANLSEGRVSSLYLRDDSGEYRAVAADGVPLDRLRSVVLTPTDGLLREMIRTGQPAQVAHFLEEITSTSQAARSEVTRSGIEATLGVPLMENGECVGALYVARHTAEPFRPETVRMLQRLAAFANVALDNAQRFTDAALERERSRANLLAQLLELSDDLNSNLTIPALTERVVEVARDLVGARAGTLGLIEGEQMIFRRFRQSDGWVDFDVTLRRGEGGPGHVWETMAPYVCNDCEHDPHVLQAARERVGFHRLAIVPLVNREGRMIGTLGVYDPVVDRDFIQRDVEALQLLAHQAAIAMENARLSEMKDAFLSIVSHELKTPVTSIKGFTQILQRRLSVESMESGGRYLEVINQQTDRLTALINDLLDLSRIQMGRFKFETEEVDYTGLVQDVVAEMQLVCPDNPINLDTPEEVLAYGNANRLRQVLVNLIDNASKYGPAGGRINVRVKVDRGEIRTYICDQGRGLPANEESRVFNPYYQVPDEENRNLQGLGLGLYISKQIVSEHGGAIWLDTAEGTCFAFSIPEASRDYST